MADATLLPQLSTAATGKAKSSTQARTVWDTTETYPRPGVGELVPNTVGPTVKIQIAEELEESAVAAAVASTATEAQQTLHDGSGSSSNTGKRMKSSRKQRMTTDRCSGRPRQ